MLKQILWSCSWRVSDSMVSKFVAARWCFEGEPLKACMYLEAPSQTLPLGTVYQRLPSRQKSISTYQRYCTLSQRDNLNPQFSKSPCLFVEFRNVLNAFRNNSKTLCHSRACFLTRRNLGLNQSLSSFLRCSANWKGAWNNVTTSTGTATSLRRLISNSREH